MRLGGTLRPVMTDGDRAKSSIYLLAIFHRPCFPPIHRNVLHKSFQHWPFLSIQIWWSSLLVFMGWVHLTCYYSFLRCIRGLEAWSIRMICRAHINVSTWLFDRLVYRLWETLTLAFFRFILLHRSFTITYLTFSLKDIKKCARLYFDYFIWLLFGYH